MRNLLVRLAITCVGGKRHRYSLDGPPGEHNCPYGIGLCHCYYAKCVSCKRRKLRVAGVHEMR